MTDMERLSVNLSTATMATLRALADGRCSTLTETVRRAVNVLKLVEEATQADGEVRIVGPDDQVQIIKLI